MIDACYQKSLILGQLLMEQGLTLAVAESCTGGALSAAITAVAGSSQYFVEGCVVYSELAKLRTLSVAADTLNRHTAVSNEVAGEMVLGLYQKTSADVCVSVTGIAGPAGGTDQQPVGTVCFGVLIGDYHEQKQQHFNGSRNEICQHAVLFALKWLYAILSR